jgi:excisionase family DNA binding protein
MAPVPDSPQSRLQNIGWAARRLSLSRAQCYRLAAEGILPVVRLGRQLRVDENVIEEWIRSGGAGYEGSWRRESA